MSSQHPEARAPAAPDVERLPPGYVAARLGGNLAVAHGDLLPPLLGLLREHRTLYDWAASRGGARALAGRGVAYAVEAPTGGGERWVVRHYRRGGAVARWLGDRYLRLGALRPVTELRASAAARARGIRTPEVLALVVYPAGLFYRADLATAEIPDAIDLAQALWAEHAAADDAGARRSALRAAGSLLLELADAGVAHPDLNAKNILLNDGECIRAHVLDLDGCRVGAPLDARARASARSRLVRSLHKWERRTGRPLTEAEWASLAEGGRRA